MIKKLCSTQFLLCFLIFVQAQEASIYQKRFMVSGKDTLLYRLLLPDNYNKAKKYPVILFLHGSGERGNDNEKQLIHGGTLFARKDIRQKFPAIVVFPQCPANDTWANYRLTDSGGIRSFELGDGASTRPMQLVVQLLGQLIKDFKVDEKRMYVGGLSMGGMGTFEITNKNPALFAAAFPICGAANVSTAKRLNKIRWWIFHGARDQVVPPASSIAMAAALKKQNAKVKFTLYPDADHNSWDAAFSEKNLFPWLFSSHR